MKRRAFIPADEAAERAQPFPWTQVEMPPPSEEDEDQPVAAHLLTAESEEERLRTVEHMIREKLQDAERKAQEIERKAYEEGFAAGENEGRAFGESQYRTYIQRLEEQLDELQSAAGALKESLGEETLALALAVGEHLAAQEIRRSPDGVRALVERVLETLPFGLPERRGPGDRPLHLHLNPQDLALLGDRFVGHSHLALLEDAGLSRGSLRLEAPQGIFDATLERRRQRLMELIARTFAAETEAEGERP